MEIQSVDRLMQKGFHEERAASRAKTVNCGGGLGHPAEETED